MLKLSRHTQVEYFMKCLSFKPDFSSIRRVIKNHFHILAFNTWLSAVGQLFCVIFCSSFFPISLFCNRKLRIFDEIGHKQKELISISRDSIRHFWTVEETKKNLNTFYFDMKCNHFCLYTKRCSTYMFLHELCKKFWVEQWITNT